MSSDSRHQQSCHNKTSIRLLIDQLLTLEPSQLLKVVRENEYESLLQRFESCYSLLHLAKADITGNVNASPRLFTSLPQENMLNTLGFLDGECLSKITAVNKHMRGEGENESLWRRLATQEWPASGSLDGDEFAGGSFRLLYLRRLSFDHYTENIDAVERQMELRVGTLDAVVDYSVLLELVHNGVVFSVRVFDLTLDGPSISANFNGSEILLPHIEVEGYWSVSGLLLSATLFRRSDKTFLPLCSNQAVEDLEEGEMFTFPRAPWNPWYCVGLPREGCHYKMILGKLKFEDADGEELDEDDESIDEEYLRSFASFKIECVVDDEDLEARELVHLWNSWNGFAELPAVPCVGGRKLMLL